MAKVTYLDEEDRKLLSETKQKLDEATKLMGELLETVEVLSDPDTMRDIHQGLGDIKSGRVKDLHNLLKKEAHRNARFSYQDKQRNSTKSYQKTSEPNFEKA